MIRNLTWDSSYWGYRLAEYDGAGEFDMEEAGKYDMVQCQTDVRDSGKIRSLEQMGFRFIDLNITYESCIEITESRCNYCIAGESDITEAGGIAQSVFRHSRFHMFPESKVAHFYKLWVTKSVRGELDDLCLLEKAGEKVVGFVTLKKVEGSSLKIGLLGVHKDHQGQAVGRKLMNQVNSYMQDNGLYKIQVSTQGSNLPAQVFYGKTGFHVKCITVWLYWFKKKV